MFGLNPNDFKPVVSDPFESDSGTTFYVEQRTDLNRICPYCKSKKIEVKGYYDTLLKCSSNQWLSHKLIIKKVRFICKECKKTFSPKISNVSSCSSISTTVKKMIILDCSNRISITDIAKKYQVSIGTVFNIFDTTFQHVERGAMPKILCIDEFHFSKSFEQNYCCCLVDFETSQLVDIIKNRRKEYLNEFFSSIDEKKLNNVEYFISDMYDEYATIRKKYLPNAIHIINRFHIVSQLTLAIKQRRTKVMKSIINSEPMLYNFIKKLDFV